MEALKTCLIVGAWIWVAVTAMNVIDKLGADTACTVQVCRMSFEE